MNRICWWLVDVLSRTLHADERAAVLGDFTEARETGLRALRNLLGLVVRRQAELWKDWRPWLGLLGVAVIMGPRLSRISGNLLFPVYMDVRTYWQHGVFYGTGLSAHEETVLFFCQALALVVWSWTGGFVLGALSRRTIWVTGSLYFLFGLSPSLVAPSLILFPLRILLASIVYRHASNLLPLACLAVLQTPFLLSPACATVSVDSRSPCLRPAP